MRLYRMFEQTLILTRPFVRFVGAARLERPTAAVERGVKGLLFDCRMCGQCALSHTGMSCPMNCPKTLRNGPCGGVRANGNCEVVPDMPCVWVDAWNGAQAMGDAASIQQIQRPVDNSRIGRSSWLGVVNDGTSGSAWPADPSIGKEKRT